MSMPGRRYLSRYERWRSRFAWWAVSIHAPGDAAVVAGVVVLAADSDEAGRIGRVFYTGNRPIEVDCVPLHVTPAREFRAKLLKPNELLQMIEQVRAATTAG